MIKILLVSPVLAVRAGLRVLLEAYGGDEFAADQQSAGAPNLRVIGESTDLEGLAIPEDADVLICTAGAGTDEDFNHTAIGTAGRLALVLLAEDFTNIPALDESPFRAWGILSVDSSAEELVAAIAAVHQGLLVGSPGMVGAPMRLQLLSEFDETFEPLTPREEEVLRHLARGLANKQIAAQLGISEHTVKFHVSSIYAKLGVTNRAEAVRNGIQRGLIPL